MLCSIKKIYRKIGSFTFFSVFLLVSFFCCFFVTNNSFATSISLPSSDVTVCNSGCSDYSFLLLNYDIPVPSVTLYSNVYINGSSVLRFNFLANQTNNIGLDFYIPISPSASTISISTPSVSSGSLTYELLTSLSSGITPSGSISLSQNGTYDVTQYAEAVVDVPPEVIQGDYHDDLTNIYRAIITCGAILLVLYFFYCIYRVIIKTTGGF